MLGKMKLSALSKTVITCSLVGGMILALISFSVTMGDSSAVKTIHVSDEIQDNEFHNTRIFVKKTLVDVKGNNYSLDHNEENVNRTLSLDCTNNNIKGNCTVGYNETKNVKGNYSFGYTEKNLPLVRIYDYLRENESDADKNHRLDRLESWLRRSITETKLDAKRKCTNSTKKILWFDVWHKGSGIRNACRRVDFSKCECSCEVDFFIFNDTEKLYDPFGADAVLFQINKLKTINHPPLKREGQVFVAVEREPTSVRGIQEEHFEYVINWTMTFRRDSDIYYPYGRIVKKQGKKPTKNYSRIYKKKKKAIIWFVSHCKTRSRREVYANDLGKYIDIDIVGKCGRDICPKGSKDCVERLEEKYFFRFNLENAYLTDYVTEKLFDNFPKNIVQIVGGSADYDNLVPNKTVIDVNKFDTTEDLATYLKLLMSSEELYTEYLRTKDNYHVESYWDVSQRSYCELCSMLHDSDRYKNLYYSIRDWFHDD